MNIIKITEELNKLFDKANNEFFEGKLSKPVILIQTNGRRTNTLGWCTVRKIWVNDQTGEDLYEITICAEYLNRDIYEISGTLIHEMVHLYNLANNVKDVNANGRTHNIKFKEEAEKRGLIIEKADKIGWSVTTLKPETVEFIDSCGIDKSAFSWKRAIVEKPESKRKKNESFKYVCLSCAEKITSKREMEIMCVKCNTLFELMK